MVFDILYQGFDVMRNSYYKDEYGEYWCLNGKFHREDGPAVIWSNGNQYWYLNGKCHRENGPAIIYPNGTQSWYLNGKDITDDVNKWFEDYNLIYDTLSPDEWEILKFNMLCWLKNKQNNG
jgi:hypothetical protein